MRRTLLAVLLLSGGRALADPAGPIVDEALAAERLAAHAREALDAVLGPGRAKVSVEVKGERLRASTDAEFFSPLAPNASSSESPRVLDLPGYIRGLLDSPAASSKEPLGVVPFQKSHEQSLRDAGFEIKRVEATVVLDSALGEALAQEASRLLPKVLRLNPERGDVLNLLRAPLRPAWRSAFATPGDWRAAAFMAAAFLAVLLAALIAGAALVRAARAFARELGARRPAEPAPAPRPETLPELVSGAPPGFLEAPERASSAAAAPALGRRFDFLAEREPGVVLRALSGEKPEDLALLFGVLAESMPETATRLFSSLPAELQTAVSQGLLGLTTSDPDKVAAIEDRLRAAVANGVEGTERLARILSRVPGEERADLLGRLAARDAGETQRLEERVFAFEDLGALAPAELRRLLAAAPFDAWGVALRGAPRELSERVLAELPAGPRELAREASETPQARDKILAARSRILDAAARLADAGELRLGRGEDARGLV